MDTFEREWAEKTGVSLFESTAFPKSIPSIHENDLRFSGITPIRFQHTKNTPLLTSIDKEEYTSLEQKRYGDSNSRLDIPQLPEFSFEAFEVTSSDIDALAERVQSMLRKDSSLPLRNKETEASRYPLSNLPSEDILKEPEVAPKFQPSELDILPNVFRANQFMSELLKSKNLTNISDSSSSLSSQNEYDTLVDPERTKILPPISFSTFLLSDKHKSFDSNDTESANSLKQNSRDECLANVDQALANIRAMKASYLSRDKKDSVCKRISDPIVEDSAGRQGDSATIFNDRSVETVKTNTLNNKSKSLTDSNNNSSTLPPTSSSDFASNTINSLGSTSASTSSKAALGSSTKLDNILDTLDSIEYIPISLLKKNNSKQIESILKNILQESNDSRKSESLKDNSLSRSSKTLSSIGQINNQQSSEVDKSTSSNSIKSSTSRNSKTDSRVSFARSISSDPSSTSSSAKHRSNSPSLIDERKHSLHSKFSSKGSLTTSSRLSDKTTIEKSGLTTNDQNIKKVGVQFKTLENRKNDKISEKSQPKIDHFYEEMNHSHLTVEDTRKSAKRKESSTILLDSSLSSNASLQPNRTIEEQCYVFLKNIKNGEDNVKQIQKELLYFVELYKKVKKKVKFVDGHVSFEGESLKNIEKKSKSKNKRYTKDQIDKSRIEHQKAKLERTNQHREVKSTEPLPNSNLSTSSTAYDEKQRQSDGLTKPCVQCGETRPKYLVNATKTTESHSFVNDELKRELNVNNDEEEHETYETNESFVVDYEDDKAEKKEYGQEYGQVYGRNYDKRKKVQKSDKTNVNATVRSRSGHCYCCRSVPTERKIRVCSHCVKTFTPTSTVASSSTSKVDNLPLRGNNNHNRITMDSTKHTNRVQSLPRRSTASTNKIQDLNFKKHIHVHEKLSNKNKDMTREDIESDLSFNSFHSDYNENYNQASRASSASYIANVNRSVQTSILIDNTPRQRTPPVNSSSLFSGNLNPFFDSCNVKKQGFFSDSRRPIVYFLPFDSVPSKSPPSKRSHDVFSHSMIQVPVRSSTLPTPELTIQEAFHQRCRAFRQRSAARVRHIQASAERRIETADQRKKKLAQDYAIQRAEEERQRIAPKPIVIRTVPYKGKKSNSIKGLTHKEMRAQTEKIYQRLPEVRAADKYSKKEDEAKRRRVMADIFKQRLKENAIRGKLNWPITTLAITA